MKRVAGALLPLLLWACEPAALPDPSIVSVTPERIPAGYPAALSVQVSAVLPVTVDYEAGDVDPAQLEMTVQVAGQEVDIPFVDREGTLIVPVPEGLEAGDYDVRVALADGRAAVRERAFSIVTVPTTHGGGEDGAAPGGASEESPAGIFGLRIDPIADQVRGVPFQITVRALGPAAESFHQTVTFRANKGTVNIHTPCSSSRGVQAKEISLSHPSPHVYLLAETAQGHKALSNAFRVRPQ